MEVDFSQSTFFWVFLLYLKQMWEQLSFHNLACQVQLLTDLFCDLLLTFCLALEGCGTRLVPLHTSAARKYSGWLSSAFRRALLQPSAVAATYCVVCCARNVVSFLIRSGGCLLKGSEDCG